MISEDFIKTIEIEGIKVDIGQNDYGQCYYFEYEKDGQKFDISCGTYNADVISYIFFELCSRYRKLWGKNFRNELTDEEKIEYQEWEKKIREKEKEFYHG